jgi:hypothetical protein
MSYGKYMLERPPISPDFLPPLAGEAAGSFLAMPTIYAAHGIYYVREGSVYADPDKALYRVRFRLKDRKP